MYLQEWLSEQKPPRILEICFDKSAIVPLFLYLKTNILVQASCKFGIAGGCAQDKTAVQELKPNAMGRPVT